MDSRQERPRGPKPRLFQSRLRRIRFVVAIVGLGSYATAHSAESDAGATFTDAELAPLLERAAHQEPEHEGYSPWAKVGLADPRAIILGHPIEHADDAGGNRDAKSLPLSLGAASARLAAAYGLSPEAARAFLAARLLLEPDGGWFQPLSEGQAGRALDAHLVALQMAPGNVAVIASLVGARHLARTPGYEAAVVDALDHARSPVEIALRLSRGSLAYWSCEFSAYAVSREPASLNDAIASFGLGDTDEYATTFYLAAFRSLTSSHKTQFPDALAERLIRNLLKEGQVGLALGILSAYPTAARANLLAGHWKARGYAYKSGLRVPGELLVPSRDVRRDIATAYLIAGNTADARTWYTAMEKGAATRKQTKADWGPREVADEKLQLELLSRRLHHRPEADAFDLLLFGDDGSDDVGTTELFAEAIEARYRQRARRELNWLVRSMGEKPHPGAALMMRNRLGFLDAAEAELMQGRAAEAKRLQGEVDRLTEHKASGEAAPDGVTAGIRARLATPPLQVFTEKALNEVQHPSAGNGKWIQLSEKEASLPKGFWLVRAERNGNTAVAVALSQRLDPTGELSGGGYWVFLSDDGAAHWGAPLYTGLREYHPYHLEEKSTLPMLEGSALRFAASVKELDEESITLPPVELRSRKETPGRVLAAPIAALSKDSDSDGLTDLVEDRLLLDPTSNDTDADGIPDGTDFLPQVRDSNAKDRVRAELISALLFELSGNRKPTGFVTGLPEATNPSLVRLQGAAPTSLDDLRFLALDRSELAGVRTLGPTIAFNEEELERAKTRFGTFYPLTLELDLSAAGDRALLVWSEGWRGGSFLATRKDGHWVLENRGSWVT